jgi:hypothetical protein
MIDIMVFIRFKKGYPFPKVWEVEWQSDFCALVIIPKSHYIYIRENIIDRSFMSISEIQFIKPKKAAYC